MLNAANMYPWYRDSMSQLGQFCPPTPTAIKTENGYNDCMLALDYAHNKVRKFFHYKINLQGKIESHSFGTHLKSSDPGLSLI